MVTPDLASHEDVRLRQLKGLVHPVEKSNADDAEQQDGKGE
jgi:hypothetical protein